MSEEKALHIAIIPDGNRRWARERGLHPWSGHEKAVDIFRKIADYCREDERISTLTIWCFSTENWKRDPEEVSKLMSMLEGFLKDEREKFMKNKTRFLHSGRKDRIPRSLAKIIEAIEADTKDFTDHTLHIALDYGGKDEVVRAMRKMKDEEPTEESIRSHLDHPELPDIDVIVRTSGENRTSNFFLWQSAYTEWYFLDKYFPDFTTEDLKTIIDDFAKRSRRFGA